jgi:hypothetical protein
MIQAKKTPGGGTGGKTERRRNSTANVHTTKKIVKPKNAIAFALSEAAFVIQGTVILKIDIQDGKAIRCVVTTAGVNK